MTPPAAAPAMALVERCVAPCAEREGSLGGESGEDVEDVGEGRPVSDPSFDCPVWACDAEDESPDDATGSALKELESDVMGEVDEEVSILVEEMPVGGLEACSELLGVDVVTMPGFWDVGGGSRDVVMGDDDGGRGSASSTV